MQLNSVRYPKVIRMDNKDKQIGENSTTEDRR
jgi:hypothetical protein